MVARDAGERHRAATPLELFFDLCFVVAVAQAGSRLHHDLSAGHAGAGVLHYVMVFFAIWWAWVNFTWFASAYDTDDAVYRITTFVQITGALVLAAGVPRAAGDHPDFRVVTFGYVIMRLALVAQWLRAAAADPARRPATVRFAVGVSLVQVGWVLLLALPDGWGLAAFVVLGVLELAVPIWAERATATTWHPDHIVERYGLFTLIVLGESVLAATLAIQAALDAGQHSVALLPVAGSGLVIVFSMWWLYFAKSGADVLTSLARGITWGYGHYLIFSSAAAVGAGLAVAVDRATSAAPVSARLAGYAVAVPVAVYILSVWALHLRPGQRWSVRSLFPAAALVVLAAPVTPAPGPVVALVIAALVAVTTVVGMSRARPVAADSPA
jgi:low temperature requirement protein LtrA